MRKLVMLSSLFLAIAIPAMAQEESSKVDVSAGYTYIRFNVKATPVGGGAGGGSRGFNVNGGSGSIAWNLNRTFGIVADLGGATKSQTVGGTNFSANLFTYMFGPRISSRGKRWTPFAQALFGGARGSGTIGGAGGGTGSRNVFAFAVGGGLDANLSEHIAVRVIQAEYFYTNFTGTAGGFTVNHQNNARITAGLVFRFGK